MQNYTEEQSCKIVHSRTDHEGPDGE